MIWMMRVQSGRLRRESNDRRVTIARRWRSVCGAIALVAGCANSPIGCSPQESDSPLRGPFPRQTVAGSEVRVLPRAANGRAYQLYVGLPNSYEEDPERRYPVLYLCDGYWDFNLVTGLQGNLVVDKAIPEIIVVGIGYPGERPDYGRLRRWDLTPAPAKYQGANYDGPSGHAQEFLSVIEHEIIPLVEREYRGDPSYRALAGSSLGGLFTLYAMLARSGLFAAYVAPSPAAQWAEDWLLGFEEEFHRSGQPLGARLFVTYAEKEPDMILGGIKRFDARLRERAYPGLTYEFRTVEGEGHSSTKAESYNRGVRFAFSPRAPQPE
jgi:predicted alpha/beta superfamily hydrolase